MIELGEEDEAAGAVARLAARLPPTGGFTLTAWFMGAAAWYELKPDDRPMLDLFMQDDLFAETNALFRSFLAARENGMVDPDEISTWPNPEQIGVLLPARWAAELALRLPARKADLRSSILVALEEQGVPVLLRLPESVDQKLRAAAVEHLDAVIELLWPQLDPVAGRRNLRVTLSYLTRTLEPSRRRHAPAWFVRAELDTIQLVDAGISIDVRVFESQLHAAQEYETQGLASKAIDALQAACEIYEGPFLDGIDDEWVMQARAEFRQQAVSACCRLAELLAAGDLEGAGQWAERAIDLDPLSIEAHETLVSVAPNAVTEEAPDAVTEEVARVRFDRLLDHLA